MACLELALEEINANCQSAVKGFEKIGWMIPWSYIDHVNKMFVGSQAVFNLLGVQSATNLHPRWNDSEDVAIYGTDRFGFNLLPNGRRFSYDGAFSGIGQDLSLWSSVQINTIDALGSWFDIESADLSTYGYKKNNGFSIRAVRTATTEEQLLPDGLISETYTDYDGNIYKCTKIGLQVWTTTTLKVIHYADGTLIPTNLSDADWCTDTDGACAVYGKNDGAFVPIAELDTEAKMIAAYGRLYNWYAVDNAHGLIDTTDGWHVPTDAEFTQLTDYLIATYPEITIDNVGDVLKSVRQVNSPYIVPNTVAYPIYERSLNPFKGTKTEGKNEAAGYYPNWTETVVFPILTNDPANANLVKAMSNEEERFVFILEQIDKGIEDNARYTIFGLRNGLTLKGSVNDASTGIAWLATFEGLNLPDAALFLGAPNDTAEDIALKFDAIPKAV